MYLIAEIGTNHNGDPVAAVEMANSAIKNGADAVKMQLFEADTLVSKTAPVIEHAPFGHATQWERMKSLELPESAYAEVSQLCSEAKIDFVISPFSVKLVEVAAKYATKLKVASGELTNKTLTRACRDTGIPCFLSTGMATLSEILDTIYWLDPTVIMHCVSLYPTLPCQANLARIQTFTEMFPNRTIGYSNHTVGPLACVIAAALGAKVFEVHYRDNETWACADARVSLLPRDFRKLKVDLLKASDMIQESPLEDAKMRFSLRRGPSGLRGDYVQT